MELKKDFVRFSLKQFPPVFMQNNVKQAGKALG